MKEPLKLENIFCGIKKCQHSTGMLYDEFLRDSLRHRSRSRRSGAHELPAISRNHLRYAPQLVDAKKKKIVY